MTDNRQTRAKKNIFSSLISQAVMLLCGIIVPGLMIAAFGSESYGAVTSITQFLSYIALLEGGIGAVARAALYKPLANNDMDTIGEIMGELKAFFRIVACIFACYVLVLSCSFHSISRVESMEWITSFLLVIVISISTFGQYFIGISNSILLQAAQKSYITNLVSICATVVNTLSTVFMIGFGCSLIEVKLVSSLIFFMRPVVLWLYVKKNFHIKEKIHKANTYLSQKWTGMGQHLAFFLHTNTDIVVLTLFADLPTVAVYSVYNMIVSQIQNFAMSFVSGMEALFGDMLVKAENEKLQDSFRSYETILSLVSVILFSAVIVLIVPFVKVYTSGINDANYVQPLFAVLMALTALSYCLRLPYHSMVIAAGHFKETKKAAYGEAFINILLSIILVNKFGLAGIAIATFSATWFRFLYYVFYLSKNIFLRKVKLFFKRILINLFALAVNCFIGSGIVSVFTVTNYISWLFSAAASFAVIAVLTFTVNLCFFKKDCIQLIKGKLC